MFKGQTHTVYVMESDRAVVFDGKCDNVDYLSDSETYNSGSKAAVSRKSICSVDMTTSVAAADCESGGMVVACSLPELEQVRCSNTRNDVSSSDVELDKLRFLGAAIEVPRSFSDCVTLRQKSSLRPTKKLDNVGDLHSCSGNLQEVERELSDSNIVIMNRMVAADSNTANDVQSEASESWQVGLALGLFPSDGEAETIKQLALNLADVAVVQ